MALLLTAAGILALVLVAHEANASMELSEVNAGAFAERAVADVIEGVLTAAAYEFEHRDVHARGHAHSWSRASAALSLRTAACITTGPGSQPDAAGPDTANVRTGATRFGAPAVE